MGYGLNDESEYINPYMGNTGARESTWMVTSNQKNNWELVTELARLVCKIYHHQTRWDSVDANSPKSIIIDLSLRFPKASYWATATTGPTAMDTICLSKPLTELLVDITDTASLWLTCNSLSFAWLADLLSVAASEARPFGNTDSDDAVLSILPEAIRESYEIDEAGLELFLQGNPWFMVLYFILYEDNLPFSASFSPAADTILPPSRAKTRPPFPPRG